MTSAPAPTTHHRTLDRLIPPALFIVALLVYLTYGLQGEFRADSGLYTYAAQQMLRGAHFYAGTFAIKGPLSVFVLAGGMGLGRLFGLDDLLAARLTNLLFSCLCVVAVYALGRELLRSRRAGVFAALTFLTFFTFGMYAGSGPRAKTFLVLPFILCLWWAARRRWFWAGLAGALAALVWQPMALAPLVLVILAGVQTAGPARERLRAALRAVVGVALPLVAVIIYFAAAGALRQAVEATVRFNLSYIDRGPVTLAEHLWNPIRWSMKGYAGQWVLMLLGLATLIALSIGRRRQAGGLGALLAGDSAVALLILTPLLILWSFYDFGSPTDLYPLLPAFAIGFGKLLDLVVGGAARAIQRPLEVSLCVALIAGAIVGLASERDQRLPAQRQQAQQIEELLGSDGVLLAINAPEVLTLTGRANPTRFLGLIGGVDRYIEAVEPGGMAGWMQRLRELKPRVVALGAGPKRMDTIPSTMMTWLKREYDKQVMGIWNIYVLKRE